MTQGVVDQQVADKAPSTSTTPTKYVYFFGGGSADGNGRMKDVLGGKGAGLAEMTNAGLPVPPGFTIQTEACREYMRGKLSPEIDAEMHSALERLERLQGQKLGAGENPLLVSVRSGAKFSMPGMMDTILNLGLNDQAVEALAQRSSNPRFAFDSYRRLIQMFGDVVLDIPKKKFEHIFDGVKEHEGVKFDYELGPDALKKIIAEYKKLVKKETGKEFPQSPLDQLVQARDAVFRSWQNERAKTYRRINHIDDWLGTAVNVQAMVFGNLGDSSGTGVGFTRNPATGERMFFGEYLMNAQGEDVVSGVRTPLPISELERVMPKVYDHLRAITWKMEKHYRDMQDFEFTIQDGKLYMLQTRNGKRTGLAAVRIAIDMVREGLITQEEAIFRVEPNQLYDFLVPRLDEKGAKIEVLATGLPASPGAAVGQIVFTAEDAVKFHTSGHYPVIILVRGETTPEDIAGMEVATGILTSRGGMTSHAAVVTRGMGKCCVAGAGDCVVDEARKELRVKGKTFKQGDWISLDGTTGRVIDGRLKTIPARPDDADLVKFMSWADPVRKLRIRANADVPRDAKQARLFGAEGIGLCRTEHMFFAEGRIEHVRAMILAENEKPSAATRSRSFCLCSAPILWACSRPWNRCPSPFACSILRCMSSCPSAKICWSKSLTLKTPSLARPSSRNCVFCSRGSRSCTKSTPCSACAAAVSASPSPRSPRCRCAPFSRLRSTSRKMAAIRTLKLWFRSLAPSKRCVNQSAIIRRIAELVFKEKGTTVDYMVGTMIELPRAALTADQIAEEAEFFSFGTNDLTQTTYGISRDDINHFLPAYLKAGIFKQDPFATLDQAGVGTLVKMATAKGRNTRPNLKVGICGEHGGDPESVKFCHKIGLNYVSCSPFRLLTARLAAAQAALQEQQTGPDLHNGTC